MSVHSYPLLLSLYKGEGRILIVPLIDHAAGYSIDAEWYENVLDIDNASKVGRGVICAVDYIRNSPLSTLTPKEREENAAWKKNSRYKSKVTFWKNNHYVRIKITEDNQYIIHSMKKSEKRQGAYAEVIKEIVLPIDASAEEIGKSVIDTFFASEKFYENNKTYKMENKKEILLLDGKRILVDLPWTDKWMDYQESGSAEIYQNYKYLSQNGEILADIFWGLAPELDCDLGRDNIMASWQDIHGEVSFNACMPLTDSIFSLRAEMNNVDLCKISYYVQTSEDLLLECGLQVYKKYVPVKQIEKFIKLFEDLIANSKFE